jgi:16S rRNA processing protein RimM
VALGRVQGAHGVQGQVRVRWFGDGPEGLLSQKVVWLVDEERLAAGACFLDPTGFDRVEVLGGGTGRAGEVRLVLSGVGDREAAEALRGKVVVVPASALEALPEGEFYWHQLVGCQVRGSDGTVVGTVRELMETGAHDVLVVEDAQGRRHLIPTADELVHAIDVEAGEIVVELLPGLLDGD